MHSTMCTCLHTVYLMHFTHVAIHIIMYMHKYLGTYAYLFVYLRVCVCMCIYVCVCVCIEFVTWAFEGVLYLKTTQMHA